MELRQIEYLVGVVDHGTFTRAAEVLHVAQPSLSQAIARLEAELGVELFHRVGRRALLSSGGEAFLEPARQLLRDLTVLRDSVAAVGGLLAGTLDVVALPTLAADPLAPLIGAFRRAHPAITVRITAPEAAEAVVELVRSGRCEVGLAEPPGTASQLVAEPLLEHEVLAIRPPGSHPGLSGRLAIASLRDEPLVTSPPGTSTRRLIDQALAAAGIEPFVAVETAQREAILPLVLAGAGTSFLPRPLAEAAARQGATVIGLDPPLRRTIGLVYRPGPLSPAAARFVSLTRANLGVQDDAGP